MNERLGRRPQSLLFICSQNAVRSPMAEAMAKHIVGPSTYVVSAGVRPGDPDPFVAAVLDEIGIALGKHRPRSFEELEDSSFDVIVTLSPEAHHHALDLTRTMAIDVIYWPTFDPTVVTGSRNQVLEAYRDVRDALWNRIRLTFGRGPMGSV